MGFNSGFKGLTKATQSKRLLTSFLAFSFLPENEVSGTWNKKLDSGKSPDVGGSKRKNSKR